MRLPIRLAAFTILSSSLVACALGATSLTPPPIKGSDAGIDAAKDSATAKDAAQDVQVETPDADVPDNVAPVCTLQQSFGDQTCDNCMEQSCCVETNACLGSSQCNNFLGCLSSCVDGDGGFDQNCANACASQNPSGAQAYTNMSSCGDNFCRNQCFQ
ncbi:hypothetical protein BH09MYX1_BH09MYX1_44600 [soil metagenome]